MPFALLRMAEIGPITLVMSKPGKELKKSPSATSPSTAGKKLKMSSFCAMDGDTLVLNILGTPSAKKDAIGKPKGTQLKVSVTATPVAGKATDHMVRFLAKEFGVATTDITVVFGRYNVNKQLRIKAPGKLPPVVARALPAADDH